MFDLKIKINFGLEEKAKMFYKSIKPELVNFSRSETKISLRKETMLIEIKASDKSAMRASLSAIRKPLILFTQLEELL